MGLEHVFVVQPQACNGHRSLCVFLCLLHIEGQNTVYSTTKVRTFWLVLTSFSECLVTFMGDSWSLDVRVRSWVMCYDYESPDEVL